VRVQGVAPGTAALVASPHHSWLDIPVLGGVMDCAFLSKAEVRQWPVVGWLAARAGTLFVRRGERRSAEEAVARMEEAIAAGREVVFFPEGTTTSGELRRFRPRLFAAAVTTGAPVQPVALVYPDGDGGTHPAVTFTGTMQIVPHALAMLRVRRVEARVCFLPPVAAAGRSPAELARLSEERVRAALERCRGG
jgi:1-acyl-sn-glycerol-3-phosphate acyltransferase